MSKKATSGKHTAIYVRVSSESQKFRSQTPDLKRFADGVDGPVKWYKDKASGSTMDRPAWNQLEADLAAGKINRIVVWKLDRLGRTSGPMLELFDRLKELKVELKSLNEPTDMTTPHGKMFYGMLALFAEYEREVRAERQTAGISAAKESGKTWGGSKKGWRSKDTQQKEVAIRKLYKSGEKKSAIAKSLGVSRGTVYRVLNDK